MATPNNVSSAQLSQAKTTGSTGPSTPAATTSVPTANGAVTASAVAAGLSSHSSDGTPRSNLPTMQTSPANHRSPLNVRSPAAIRSVGGTPMMRAASANAHPTALGASPMQRGDTTIGLKSVGTPGRSGTVAGKSPLGATSLASVAGLGIAQSNLPGGSPNLSAASPGLGATPGNINSLTALAGFGSPATNLNGPGTTSTGLPGAVDMDVSLSGLGFSVGSTMSVTGSSGGGRLDDDERRRRLELVLDMLRKRPGRVSREAIERLGRRCELDMQLDGDELSLAGKNAVMLEVQFKPNNSSLVERVGVAFPTASDTLAAYADKASKILHQDLTPPPGVATINASLDRFSENLERLARLDKLSMPGANCFEAVFGVYTGLRKLYENEKKLAETILKRKGESTANQVELEVVCKKSGKPEMHVQRRVGLSIQYWKHKRLLSENEDAPPADGDHMEIDNAEIKDSGFSSISNDVALDGDAVYLTVECEASSPALYPPIRITDSWLSEDVKGNAEDTGNNEQTPASATDPSMKQNEASKGLQWQDPLPTLIPTAEPDPMSGLAPGHQAQPQARFVAKFEPPIALPLEVAAHVYANVGINIMQENLSPSVFEALLLPPVMMETEPFTRSNSSMISPATAHGHTKRAVLSYDSTKGTTSQEWDVRLFAMRAESAIPLSQLPFSHPRQIVEILPILRQYTFLNKLIQSTFGIESQSGKTDTDNGGKDPLATKENIFPPLNGEAKAPQRSHLTGIEDVVAKDAAFADFLADTEQHSNAQTRALDIAMSFANPSNNSVTSANPLRAPRLTVNVPGASLSETSKSNYTEPVARMTIVVLPNAEIEIELHGMEHLDSPPKIGENGSTEPDQDVEMRNPTAGADSSEPGNPKQEPSDGETNNTPVEKQSRNQKLKKALLEALLVSEDLAVWAEWLIGRFPSKA